MHSKVKIFFKALMIQLHKFGLADQWILI